MLIVAALGLAGLAGVQVVRWSRHRVDSLGRVQPFPTVTVALCAVIGLACMTPVLLHVRLEQRLSTASSQVAGVDVRVDCQGFGGAFVDVTADLGHVAFDPDGVPERETTIKWQQCRDVAAWLRSASAAPSRDQVVAVHVVTHEAMHMRGITEESAAECAAVQRLSVMAQTLGAQPDDAAALAHRYWTEVYPAQSAEYRSAECTAGGDLDEHLSGAPWS
jgi:hypothetical protein